MTDTTAQDTTPHEFLNRTFSVQDIVQACFLAGKELQGIRGDYLKKAIASVKNAAQDMSEYEGLELHTMIFRAIAAGTEDWEAPTARQILRALQSQGINPNTDSPL